MVQVIHYKKGKELNLGENLADLAFDLEIEINRFKREGQDFTNFCYRATQAFGRILNTPYEDESSFLEQYSADFFDLRSKGRLRDSLARFHSIGQILIPDLEICLGVDISEFQYSDPVIYLAESDNELLESLSNQYGGRWNPKLKLIGQNFKYVD